MKKENPTTDIDSAQLELNFFIDDTIVHSEGNVTFHVIDNEVNCTAKIINLSDRLHDIDKLNERKIVDYIVLNSKRF